MRTPSMSKMIAWILGMEELPRRLGPIGAKHESVVFREPRDQQPIPRRLRIALVQFGRDHADILACVQVPADQIGGPPQVLKTIEPDAVRLTVKRRLRLHLAVPREDAGAHLEPA